jgi:type IV pilus biogenesis protein CpaD/CtpE
MLIKWILVVGVLAALGGCAFEDKSRASADCDARAVEARLIDIEKARHKNICMIAKGYKRNNSCRDRWSLDQSGRPECFTSRWYFWVEEEALG